jgi:tetratricopeptide (TPR) repeat protein
MNSPAPKLLPLCTLCALVMAGCAGTRDNTLASLGDRVPVKIEKDAVITSARDKAMENYWEFMNSAPKDSLRVEAMRRLADLELERSEDQMQQKLAKKSSQQQAAAQQADAEMANTNFDKAIKLYEEALRVSKQQTGAEDKQVLYQVSKAYEQAGEPEKALDALNRLLTQYPDIENRDEIHFRRGELMFQLKQYRLAELAYTQAMVVDSSSPYYEKALSKKGWTAYKQNEYDKALYSFLSLVDRKMRDNTGKIRDSVSHLSQGDKELLKDIFRVVVLSFDELGGPKAIGNYFERHGHRAYERRVYKDMGDHYLDQGRIRDAANAFKAFVKKYPFHHDAPTFDMYAINAFAAGGFASLLTQAKIEFAQTYRIKGEYWKKHNEKEHRELLPLLAKNMEDVARHYHAEAQKTKNPRDYTMAMLWYRNYIRTFPKTKKSAELNFLLAETLFENKQYEMAAKEYEKTAYQYVKSGKNAEAGYAALVAYGELVKQVKGKQKEIWERLTIGSALRFGKAFPEDSRAPAVVTKAAEDLFALKKYDQASVAARTILELTSDTTLAMRRTAWMIVAQAEFQNAQYARAESAYKIAMTMAKDDPKLRKTITDGLAASVYKRGEQLKAAGDLKGAVAQFGRVAKVAPGSDINVAAEFDIAANLIAQENWPEAIKQLKKFRAKYPKSSLQQKVSQNLAAAYLKLNQPMNAAKEMENLMIAQKDTETKRAMLWQIAQLYEQAGDQAKVKDAYRRYTNQYPTPVDQSIEAQQKLAELYQGEGDTKNYYYWLKQIIKTDADAGQSRTDRTHYLAANAAFTLAKPELDRFKRVKLVAPLKTNLKVKKQRMKEAVDAFTSAANYGVEEVTTASVYWLAEIYKTFGKELIESERPKGLSPEELEQYDILLEEQAYPFEEKSIDIYESNVKRVQDGTYDKWVKKSFAALETLRPARYRKEEKSEVVANGIL